MQGLHLIADLHGCAVDRPAMVEPGALRAGCLDAVAAAGLQAVGELFHRFQQPPSHEAGQPVGITGVVLLAESHLAVHTWPEIGAATVDVYVCNLGADNTSRAHALFDALLAMFTPTHVERREIARGDLVNDEPHRRIDAATASDPAGAFDGSLANDKRVASHGQ